MSEPTTTTAPSATPAPAAAPATPSTTPAPDVTPAAATPAAPNTLLGDPGAAKPGEAAPYTLTLPADTIFDPKSVEELTKFAQGLGLTAENAQKLVERDDQMLRAHAEHIETAQREAWGTQVADWRKAVEADPEIGGAKLTETVAYADKAMRQFVSPEFRQLLDASGFGNHPDVVKLFARIGRAISEDSFTTKGDESAKADSPAKTLFPTMN